MLSTTEEAFAFSQMAQCPSPPSWHRVNFTEEVFTKRARWFWVFASWWKPINEREKLATCPSRSRITQTIQSECNFTKRHWIHLNHSTIWSGENSMRKCCWAGVFLRCFHSPNLGHQKVVPLLPQPWKKKNNKTMPGLWGFQSPHMTVPHVGACGMVDSGHCLQQNPGWGGAPGKRCSLDPTPPPSQPLETLGKSQTMPSSFDRVSDWSLRPTRGMNSTFLPSPDGAGGGASRVSIRRSITTALAGCRQWWVGALGCPQTRRN